MATGLDSNLSEDKAILDKHISNYIEGINKTIIISEFLILLGTIFVAILIWSNIFNYKISDTIFNVSKNIYILEQIIHKLLAWVFIGIYFIIYKRITLEKKKNLLCSLSITLSSLLAFGCWNEPLFGLFFITPVIISIPLSTKTQTRMFIICIILSFIYSIAQAYLKQDQYMLIIGILIMTSVAIFYFISLRLHKTMYGALLDVKEYSSISRELYEEVSHDRLTNALSVTALQNDVENLDKKFKSLAFIDLDNFKSINDKYGHTMGDNILKLLVNTVQINKEIIYRYGGDEFVILSKNSAQKLSQKLENIKSQFSDGALTQYNINSTVSIGVINIVVKEKLYEYLQQCDRLMYISKEKGKNQITMESN